MTTFRSAGAATAVLLLAATAARAAAPAALDKPGDGATAASAKPAKPAQPAGAGRPFGSGIVPVAYLRTVRDGHSAVVPRLPLSRLTPSHLVPNLCVVTYRITTESP